MTYEPNPEQQKCIICQEGSAEVLHLCQGTCAENFIKWICGPCEDRNRELNRNKCPMCKVPPEKCLKSIPYDYCDDCENETKYCTCDLNASNDEQNEGEDDDAVVAYTDSRDNAPNPRTWYYNNRFQVSEHTQHLDQLASLFLQVLMTHAEVYDVSNQKYKQVGFYGAKDLLNQGLGMIKNRYKLADKIPSLIMIDNFDADLDANHIYIYEPLHNDTLKKVEQVALVILKLKKMAGFPDYCLQPYILNWKAQVNGDTTEDNVCPEKWEQWQKNMLFSLIFGEFRHRSNLTHLREMYDQL